MKKFYIIDQNNGTFPSANDEKRYVCLSGKKLFEYLQTEEGSKKVFYTEQDDSGNLVGVEVSEDMRKEYESLKRHKRYLRTCQQEAAYTIVSFNSELDGKDGSPMTYEDILPSDDDILEKIEKKSKNYDIKKSASFFKCGRKMDYRCAIFL